MRGVRSSDTSPELLFRRALRSKGIRFRSGSDKLPGKPDIVLPSKRVAIFIDGDFWHGGQWRKRNLSSLEEQFKNTQSREYWLRKIRRNMHRDCLQTKRLLDKGWKVLRFWESQVYKDLESCLKTTEDALAEDRETYRCCSLLPAKTFAEFFSGIGLMRIGLEKQGWVISFANDIDQQKCEMYKAHFSDADRHLVCGDIHKMEAEQVPSVTLATASFPCNDLSLAGGRVGLHGKESSAFWGFVSLLEKMENRKPPIVLLENVVGFLSSHRGSDFRQALTALNGLGYCVDTFILDAADFVPQSRQRLFVVGILDDCIESHQISEQLQFYESAVRPKALADFIFKNKEINWNIRRLPSPPRLPRALENILEDVDESSPEWWNPERAGYLLNQMSPRHREIAERMIHGHKFTYGTVFRRIRHGKSMAELRTDGVAGCLRTPRGGSGRQILLKAGMGKYFVRLVNPRECARLMGADDFTINVPLNQALFGFGDAVCVPVIEWIAEHYLNPVVNELMKGRPLAPLGRRH